jgi:hypothetical protein
LKQGEELVKLDKELKEKEQKTKLEKSVFLSLIVDEDQKGNVYNP